MSPTSSPRRTSKSTSCTALFPPKLTLSPCVRSQTGDAGTAGRRGAASVATGNPVGRSGEALAPKRERLMMCSRASRPLYRNCTSPPGRYRSKSSKPMPDVRSRIDSGGAVGLNSAGMPFTQSTPRNGPAIEPSPPMTEIATTSIENAGAKVFRGAEVLLQGPVQGARQGRHRAGDGEAEDLHAGDRHRGGGGHLLVLAHRPAWSGRCRCAATLPVALSRRQGTRDRGNRTTCAMRRSRTARAPARRTGRTAVVPPVKTSWARIQLAEATANAKVATARNKPRTRSAGTPMISAASAPRRVLKTTAVPQFNCSDRSKMLSGMGMSCPLVRATRQNAPRPTNANCPREI